MAFVTSPVDVAKTRLMNQGTSIEGIKYTGILDCLWKVNKLEIKFILFFLDIKDRGHFRIIQR